MAKPYQNAALICTVLSILALIGIVIGLIYSKPLVILLFLLPTILYEVYRTEGESTKLASWGLLVVYLAEIAIILFGFTFNIAQWLGRESLTISGYHLPLGNIALVGPVLMAILSIILFVRTRGIYTKWLSVIIIITSIAALYALDTAIFDTFLKFAVDEGLDQVNL